MVVQSVGVDGDVASKHNNNATGNNVIIFFRFNQVVLHVVVTLVCGMMRRIENDATDDERCVVAMSRQDIKLTFFC